MQYAQVGSKSTNDMSSQDSVIKTSSSQNFQVEVRINSDNGGVRLGREPEAALYW